MLTTTLNEIRSHGPCGLKPDPETGEREGLCLLLHYLGKTTTDDESLPIEVILDSNGLDDALWVFDRTQDKRLWVMLAVTFARRVQHLMADERSTNALDVAERWARGQATDAELETARDAAWDASRAAWDAAVDAEREWQASELRRVCREGLAAYGLTEGESHAN